jgi:hypothetical protein
MSRSETPTDDSQAEIHREYVADVSIVELGGGEESRYRFEAPEHVVIEFSDAGTAELYADVYFDVNGFREEGTGDIGVPPEIVQAGKDTLAAYLLTQPHTSTGWIASFYGKNPEQIDRYVAWVQERAAEIRAEAQQQGLE